MPLRLNLPPLTRVLLLALVALSALNATLRFRAWNHFLDSQSPSTGLDALTTAASYLSSPQWAIPFLVLVPPKSLKFPWTFVTAPVVENNVLSMSISLAVLWAGGRYLERAYGSSEFGRFVAVTAVVPNFLTFLIYTLWHISGTPQYPTPIQGLVALEAGFLVALKQLVPEHTVSLFRGSIRVRIKHFPALFTALNMLSGPIFGTDTALWLSFFGFLSSWVYLRFYRLSDIGASATATAGEGSTMRGDASDTFAFVAFWPDMMQPFLTPICDGIYETLVQLKLFKPFSEEAIVAGNENVAARSDGLPSIMNGRGGSGRRAEAERRRAIALMALEERLNAPSLAGRSTGAPTGGHDGAANGSIASSQAQAPVVATQKEDNA
ncbi:DUF1751-domain-containing protein [Acrodontium crateriforme]|uniref:DUF1751-domain-containing protein n=1 Tax=Acrodontium crateriforme TaxID=150365 RepID=A0AAQ3ME77_9PEZI|nr:DUF1751-domain-containing protein [Acrodontium crateriforme]